MPYPADLGTTYGRIPIDMGVAVHDQDDYTIEGVGRPEATPELLALMPAEYVIGDPSPIMRCIGSGFDVDSRIVFMGYVERTTFVSEGEVTTGINADVWQTPQADIPVLVRTRHGDTQTLTFDVVAAQQQADPVLNSLDPSSVSTAQNTTVRALGAGFTAESAIFVNNVAVATTLVSAGELTCEITAGVASGEYPVVVRTGAKVTAARTLTITD